MKGFLIYITCLSLVLVMLPAVVVGGWWRWEQEIQDNGSAPFEQNTSEEKGLTLQVFVNSKGEIVEMELEKYLTGVVSAEMPASFELEALKAQAVVARTYALNKASALGGSGCHEHPGADLCTDSTCCQAWEEEEQALNKWPAGEAAAYMERIREAVYATASIILSYQGMPVTAVYHSTCGGMTENARDVWSGNGAYYLQMVECNYCRHSRYYRQELAMDVAAYAAALKEQNEALPVLAEGNSPLMEVISRSQSGRNLLLNVGKPGVQYSGTEIRNLLGLPSTFFQWRVEGDKIIFSTRGHGHGVGMCQYGADGMAREGYDFIQILQHYYRGVEVEKLSFSGWQDEDTPAQGPEPPHQPAVTAPDMVYPPDF